jgi:hypothetical protein
MEDYGLKVFKPNQDPLTRDRKNFRFTSGSATHLIAREITFLVNSNPEVIPHGLGYIPKVFVYEILPTYNRKLPYDDGSGMKDFSVTKDDIKIRGTTSGTYKIFIFGQNII